MLRMTHIVQLRCILTGKFGTIQMIIIGPAGEIVSELVFCAIFQIKLFDAFSTNNYCKSFRGTCHVCFQFIQYNSLYRSLQSSGLG